MKSGVARMVTVFAVVMVVGISFSACGLKASPQPPKSAPAKN